MVNKVQIPVEAVLESGNVQKSVDAINHAAEALAKTLKDIQGIKFDPIAPAAIQDIQKAKSEIALMAQRMRDLRTQMSPNIKRRLKETGQQNEGFFDVDWSRIYGDPHTRARQMRSYWNYLTKDTSFSKGLQFPSPAAAALPSVPNTPAAPPLPPRPQRPESGFTQSGFGRTITAGLNAAGPAGGVVAGSIRTGENAYGASGGSLGMGIGAGIGGLLGGFAALGVSKLVGSVVGAVGKAGTEDVGIDTIKRQMGDLGISFDALKARTHTVADAMGTTITEAQKYTAEYVQQAGVTARNQRELVGQLTNAVGFARSFGLDPSQGVALFATARRFGSSAGENDNRRLALQIGEAVERSGKFGQTGELVGLLTNFIQGQTRSGVVAANASGYLDAASALMRSGQPGLDVGGVGAMLGQINASIAHGGAAGEASQNFSMMTLSRNGLLNPYQTRILQEGGAFGTAGSAFGSRSVYAAFANKFGLDQAPLADGRTNLETTVDGLKSRYGKKDAARMADALSNHLGISLTQSMAMLTFGDNKLGDTQGLLSRNGINLKDVNASSISALAALSSGDPGKLKSVVESLSSNSKLSAADRAELQQRQDDAAGDPSKQGALRSLAEVLTAKYGQEETEGSKTRDSINGVENAIQKMASALVPATNDTRNAIIYLAGGKSGMLTAGEIEKSVKAGERAAINRKYDAQLKAAEQYGGVSGGNPEDIGYIFNSSIDPARRAEIEASRKAELAKLEPAEAGSGPLSSYDLNGPAGGPMSIGGTAYSSNLSGNLVKPYSADQIEGYANLFTSNTQYDSLFQAAGRKYGVDWRLLKQRAVQESSLRPSITNSAGARGLMQVMGPNLDKMGIHGDQQLDPALNIDAGARLFADALKRNGGDLGMAYGEYYGGPNRAIWKGNTKAYVQNSQALGARLDLPHGGWQPGFGVRSVDSPSFGVLSSDSTPMPSSGSKATVVGEALRIEVFGTLFDKEGRKIGELAAPATKVRPPMAARQ